MRAPEGSREGRPAGAAVTVARRSRSGSTGLGAGLGGGERLYETSDTCTDRQMSTRSSENTSKNGVLTELLRRVPARHRSLSNQYRQRRPAETDAPV